MNIQALLGIELPIIQAPMAGVQGSELAVAVSNAGGLGSLPCAMLTAEAMETELAALCRGTDKPYNVNFFAHTSPVVESARTQRWHKALSPYYSEWGLDIASIGEGAGRAPFNAAMAQLLKKFKPAVVSFHFGLPDAALLAEVRSWGAKILSTATTVEEARWLAREGVDGIIAQGLEAGGHRGIFLTTDLTTQMGTLALVRQVIQAVDVPVIAAGGIADAAGVQAALSLGAAGVQVGTAYLLCTESKTSAIHRAALQSEAARHTALTNLYSGGPARGIVNRLMRELGPLSDVAPPFPLATAAIVPLRAAAEQQGSGDFSPLWAGQNVSGCKAVSAGQLTRELAGIA